MKVALVAGEASGDLLGAGFIEAFRERVPDAQFEGIAGPRMAGVGCSVLADAEELSVMGLVEPLQRVPRLLSLRRSLRRRWQAEPPSVFVGIDAPDFNLSLELSLKKAGVPTVHYVSPSVWAWRQGRVAKIRAATDRVLCILPFEKAFYDEHGVDAVFVGHPTADNTPHTIDTQGARARLGLAPERPVVAVLPGSRAGEVSRLAAMFAESAALLLQDSPALQFVTPVATPALKGPIEAALRQAGVYDAFLLLEGQSDTAMSAADVVLLASGTAALESALLQKPTVAAYRVAASTAVIVRAFGLLKVDKFTLPNQMTESALIPELIQEDASPEALAHEVAALLGDPERRAAIAGRFAKLRSELALDSNQRAADAVLGLIQHAAKQPD